MSNNKWMLYGPTGETGQMILAEALRRGHRPVLAGRSAPKVRALAEQHDLEWAAASLDDAATLRAAVGSVGLLLNAAGPFAATSPALMAAGLQAGVNYLDIANEMAVFQAAAALQRQARGKRIVLMPGVGFGVVVSDALAHYAAEQVPGATDLEIALFPYNDVTSAGARRTALEVMAHGGRVQRQGQLIPWTLGAGGRRQRTPEGEQTVLPAPLGDLVAAANSTGIPNITTLLAFPMSPMQARLILPVLRRVLAVPALRERMSRPNPAQPTEADHKSAAPAQRHSYAWAKATDRNGHGAAAWLEAGEGYAFTAVAAVRAVETTLDKRPVGVLTPAQAFGLEFIQTIAGVRLYQSEN
jgi:short subunit dehydrogenase-like uncharacterized protein